MRFRGRKKGDPEEPEDHALGRSRGGWGTKVHVICDGQGHPLHGHVTAGQVQEGAVLDEVMIGADEHLYSPDGEAMPWPAALAGDKAYRADWIDDYLMGLQIKPVIPSKANEDREARPIPFDKASYRQRNIVERLIGWLKECRRIMTRFEKTAKNFVGMIKLAFIRYYLRWLTK